MAYAQWLAGMRITAGRLAGITPLWQDWTPVWTTSGGGSPSFGNAVVTARYATCADMVFWRLEITFGTTTAFGPAADNWRFSAPVQAAATSSMCGWGAIQDNSVGAGSRMSVRARLTSTTNIEFEMASARIDGAAIAGLGIIDATGPWTWANTDTIIANGQYEAA